MVPTSLFMVKSLALKTACHSSSSRPSEDGAAAGALLCLASWYSSNSENLAFMTLRREAGRLPGLRLDSWLLQRLATANQSDGIRTVEPKYLGGTVDQEVEDEKQKDSLGKMLGGGRVKRGQGKQQVCRKSQTKFLTAIQCSLSKFFRQFEVNFFMIILPLI